MASSVARKFQVLNEKILRGESVKYNGFDISLEATGYALFSYAHEAYDGPDGKFPCGTSNSFVDLIETIDLWNEEYNDVDESDWEYQVNHCSFPR